MMDRWVRIRDVSSDVRNVRRKKMQAMQLAGMDGILPCTSAMCDLPRVVWGR